MTAPRYLIHAACNALSALKGHHEALDHDWHVEPDGKEGDPCGGCDTIATLERAIVRAVRKGIPHD